MGRNTFPGSLSEAMRAGITPMIFSGERPDNNIVLDVYDCYAPR